MKTTLVLLIVFAASIAYAQSAKTPTNSTEQDLPVFIGPQTNEDPLPLVPIPGQSTAPDSIRPYLSESYQQDKFIDPMIIDPASDLSDKPDAWEMKNSP